MFIEGTGTIIRAKLEALETLNGLRLRGQKEEDKYNLNSLFVYSCEFRPLPRGSLSLLNS